MGQKGVVIDESQQEIDIKKVMALHRAGWTEDMIAFEMRCSSKEIEWILYLKEIDDGEMQR